jgi:amino acid adenylation domain-containing protein/non-ribosomal peptide synthase protein (TIGR01720 family)
LNGQRIELGEIEHHLRINLPARAKSAVELVRFADNTTKALVAFICIDSNSADTSSDTPAISTMTESLRNTVMEVESALGDALPAYYVPSYYMPVTNMPMTASGKLDRKVLRQLAGAVPESEKHGFRLAGKSGRAPSGHIEVTLASIWMDVLKIQSGAIGVEASFFRLGGDSIGAMRLVTACRKVGIILSVANVFAKPRLLDMAAVAAIASSGLSNTAADDLTVPFELIAKVNKERIVEFAAAECKVSPASIEDVYPCSRLQEGLIALSTRDPGTYVAQPAYRLPSNIDIARFKDAWNKVIAKEAVLRTRIIHHDEFGFLQVVVKCEIEWQSLEKLEHLEEVHRQLPANPGGPLASYTIVGEGTGSPLFVWTAHHAIYDGWSWAKLFNQVELCYRNSELPLPESVPFSRFIKYLSKLDQSESDSFWLSQLGRSSAPQFPQLPNPDYKVQASSQIHHKIMMQRRSDMEVTIPSMIRAAWGLLLATFSGSDDIIWGETNSGREAPVLDIEDIVGPTLTTAPVRLQLNRQLTVRDYLRETQSQAAASLPYQFAGLQHIQKLSTETAVACDFQSFLGIVAGDDLKDAKNELWNMESTGTLGTNFFSYALVFNCTVESDHLDVEVLYDSHLTETWYIQRLLDQFEYIMACFSSGDILDQRLDNVGMLNPADEKTISFWNKEPIPTIHRCIHTSIYEDQVLACPDAPAIDAWDTAVVSYRDLNEQSTRLASHLISLGVKPNSFVPICFDKSGWTIVAILGVLKAGAAFVPLDFEAPKLRLQEVVKDTKARFIVCAPKFEETCKSMGCTTVVVDRESIIRLNPPAQHLPDVQSNSVAYAFYTSGSTGKPKGAVINHSSWVSSSSAFAPTWGLSKSSRVLQFASYVFDACLIEIFSTLMCGGTVCVPDQASRTNDLAGVINRFNVNWATLTPSVVRTMQPPQVPNLQTLVLVGEAMSQQDLLTWVDRVTLGNGYGPTECSAISTSNTMTSKTKPNNLGRVVTSRGWVVSKINHHALMPVGAVGELLLEGPAVGAGYLNDPEKTAQVFIQDPAWAKDTMHLEPAVYYKTGDLVRYNSDGTLLYLGRKDVQTKVRGQRLELSEVEHHLMTDQLVQNALAFVPTDGYCAKRLVGIVSLSDTSSSSPSTGGLQLLPQEIASSRIGTIREHLYERLPSYMIPSLWIAVSRFPLTPGGKTDRRRVEQWLKNMDKDTYRMISSLDSEPAQDEANGTESKLRAIFAKTLNLMPEDIRLNQSFLHLGGDSIAAMQVSSQCRAQGMAVSVQELIRAKSITALAATIQNATEEDSVPTIGLEHNLPFELSPVQKLFFDTVGDSYNHFNQTELFSLSRSFTLDEIRTALQTLVATHPMLRARFSKNSSGSWQQRVEKDSRALVRLRQHHVRSVADEKLRMTVDDSQATLNIVDGPAFAVDLFDVESTSSQAIALVAHHLIIDIISWGIVLEDFEGLLNNVKPQPQSLPFHSWVQQQATQASKDFSSAVFPSVTIPQPDLEYWAMDAKPNIHADVVEQSISLSSRETMLLLGAQDALGTETLDILVAALFESFRTAFPDRPTITIHNEGHGREPMDAKQDLTRTVGWFSTLTPIYLPVASGDATDLVGTIRWVKELRERTPGKGRPYFAHRLLTEEGRTKFASHWPAELIFNYHGRLRHLDRKDTLFQQLDNIDTNEVGDDVPRLALFDVTAAISGGSLKMSFGFNRHMARQVEIQTWISECQKTLIKAVDEILDAKPEPSLSDFKLLPPIYNGMAKLHSMLPTDTTITDVEDIYPASPMQQGLLLSQMKHPELYTYHAILEVQSTKKGQQIDPRKLAEAWQVVVHRHPALRTIFVDSLAGNGSRDQIVLKNRPGRVHIMTDCDDHDIATRLREQPSIDCRELLPPHCMTICTTKTGKVWIKLELSHAINDGTSILNILNDITRSYEGQLTRADGGPLFRDYVAHVLSTSSDTAAAYWKGYLSGVEPCFFPVLNDGKTCPHDHESVEITISDSERAFDYCKKNGVTLSNVLQLAWALVLHFYVGTFDVSFGVVASGRDVPVKNIDEAVGCFVTMLITRLTFSDETTVKQLLETLQTDSGNALSHQGCSLAAVQHELQLPSLFNTAFTFQRRQISSDPEETALVYENMEAEDAGEYAITINADVTDESISVDFGFWKDRLCVSQAQNMADTFQKILQDILSSNGEDLTIGKLDSLTSTSLRQILEWNMTLPPPVNRCLHEMIQEQALLRPRTSRAVDGHDGSFTYQEFDKITDQIAVHLQTLGVTTETFVPILFERSSWAIVSMIAIMKAGGAYVPLDPKHPDTRLRDLINDVSAKVVLCSRTHHTRLGGIVDTPVIVDAQAFRKMRTRSTGKPTSSVTPDNAAYCLFTSGKWTHRILFTSFVIKLALQPRGAVIFRDPSASILSIYTDSIVLLQEQPVNLKVLSYHMEPSAPVRLHLHVG